MDGIALTLVDDPAALRGLVESHELDAGLVLPEGFDAALRAGARPELEVCVNGEAHSFQRVMIALTTLKLLRDVEGRPDPVNVVVRTFGGRSGVAPEGWSVLFYTLLVLTATGVFMPAMRLVEERTGGTIGAVLVTPAAVGEVLVSTFVYGLVLSVATASLTLAFNMEPPGNPWALSAALFVAAVMCSEIGVITGLIATDTRTVGAFMALLNCLLLFAVFVLVDPAQPRQLAMPLPVYWCASAIFAIALEGAGLEDVWQDLAVALAFVGAMAAVIVVRGRRVLATLSA
jgi:hypothetical protein